ncbi:hypothetical protein A3B02_01090 [Candidatus Roizmanbacteria bacterium RIFCSPLOWO2_01_FULL_42_14]|uniref:Uncharacterized protein n=2 Tax=Candidatus Roizmaniibacteriota TaxID=1752723 RepID=A0A1F7JA19_9BACT|nr:MAG: hypothetical protein A3D08_03425 [Candidatus Roizmanbacteria bacterium RIFCSPHIGHO2_02_FULL_43_11]OGK52445.1 MAG: hypothetical protein A3B02_01090 [Candidatus Roizmanbacteria bacterium RIFCSPLOWO2_01_FULL_42_14]
MPLQQQRAIWILIAIAAFAAVYSALTGQLFPQKRTTKEETQVPFQQLSPTPQSASISSMLSKFQKQLADKPQQASSTGTLTPTQISKQPQTCFAQTTGFSYTVYTQSPHARIDFKETDGTSGSAILTGTMLYMWDEKAHAGIKSEIKEAEFTTEDVLAFITGQASQGGASQKCTVGPISATKFSPPKTVVFTTFDLSTFGF